MFSMLRLPIPFDCKQSDTSEDSILMEDFWYDDSYNQVDWWSSTITWGGWTYSAIDSNIRHNITCRTFYFKSLDKPERLLMAITSLLSQPYGNSEHFYQLLTGILTKRHGVQWEQFWNNGEEILDGSVTKRETALRHSPPSSLYK